MNRRSRFPVRGLIVGATLLILCALVAIPSLFINARISGEEFSPQLFQKREFTYRRFPGTKIRLGNTKLSPGISPCSTFILTHLSSETKVDWHVATIQQGSISQELGPKILIDYLSCTNADGEQVWDAWSSKNPAQAAILWPVVQQVAIHELYACVPELLRHAASGLEIAKLKKILCLVCIQSALLKLKTFSPIQDAKPGIELRSWAQSMVDDFAADPEFQEVRMKLANQK